MKQKKKADIGELFGDAPIEEKDNSGAAAELAAIESDARKCRQMRDAAFLVWEEADRKNVLGDDIKEADERRAWGRYLEMRELYENATKQLAVFDKGVSKERREGEKIPVSECKDIFAQYELSLKLAMEAYIIKIAQDAALCESAESFHLAHAEAIRACREGAIVSARREGVLPNWLE